MKIHIRLGLHFIFSLFLYILFVGAILTIILEFFIPLIGITEKHNMYDFFVLCICLATLICSSLLYGWYIGKPLFFMISWIHRLAQGNYSSPENIELIYKKNSTQLKGPYRLYEDVIINLNNLTTKLKESEMERKRLDDMKQQWMAGISHDLKTPLTYVTGYSALLLSTEHDWSEEEKRTFLHEINEKGIHMESLIDDLNITFRLTNSEIPLSKEEVDMIEFMRRVVAHITNDPRASQHHFHFSAPETNITLAIDAKLLQRALQNILTNCLLHNPIGTNITTSLFVGENIHIVIKDNGAGMDDITLRNLFKQYYRGTTTNVSSEGTGLGMTIAKKIITAHGGNIRVTSRLEEGTTFDITLPFISPSS
ncbi:sensor histidine kinase [Bacillus manliponensis]|uniref:sensor histidine kinase n=1 Tax=Bacillus manliponensis TaxID=574376 RepID=UPI00351532C5